MPYPPKEKSVEEKIFPQNARNAQNLLAEKSLPQMSTDVHRLGGYGIPAIPTLPSSVYSVNSVGEQRTITICVHPCHPWEKRHSHRTHAQNLLAEKSLPQMSTDVHRLGGYGIPAIPTLPNSVYSVNSVGEQRTITICVHPCHPWESFLCRRFCAFRAFRGRSSSCLVQQRLLHPLVVYPCHLWEVLSAIGFRVFGVFCGRSTLIKFVVKNFAPTL